MAGRVVHADLMVIGLVLLGVLVLVALAGITGVGLTDSRDVDYGLRWPSKTPASDRRPD
jgi:hypothetical protein